MKKDDVFKEGANSVAKTMEKKIYEWTQDISEHTKRQDELFVNFADAVIENEEKKENDNNNIVILPSFDYIQEDRDVSIILEVLNKYYKTSEFIKNNETEEIIKKINTYSRKISLTESSYGIESISTLEDKENCSLLLYGILCLLNEATDSYPEDIFEKIKEELYLSNRRMKEIKLEIHDMCSRYYISSILEAILSDSSADECDNEIEKNITEENVNTTPQYDELVKFIYSHFESEPNFIKSIDDVSARTIANRIYIKTAIGVAKDSVIGELKCSNNVEIFFTTYSIYYTDLSNGYIELPYKKLLKLEKYSIDESFDTNLNTKFNIKISDKVSMEFQSKTDNNKNILEFFLDFFDDMDYSKFAQSDRYISLINMDIDIKIKYLNILWMILGKNGNSLAEVCCLAKKLRCLDEFLKQMDDKQEARVCCLLDDLKVDVPYPTFEIVGYYLIKDFVEILCTISLYKNEKFTLKYNQVENMEEVVNYFGIQDEVRKAINQIFTFTAKIGFIGVMPDELDRIYDYVKIVVPYIGDDMFNRLLSGEGSYWRKNLIRDVELPRKKVEKVIAWLKKQKAMVAAKKMYYTEANECLNNSAVKEIPESYRYNVMGYYKKVLEQMEKNIIQMQELLDAAYSLQKETNKKSHKLLRLLLGIRF